MKVSFLNYVYKDRTIITKNTLEFYIIQYSGSTSPIFQTGYVIYFPHILFSSM